MKKLRNQITILDFKRTYHEKGACDFRIVLNKEYFNNGHDISVDMIDPEGQHVAVDVKCWGRKINCSFTIDDDMPDGVCVLNIDLHNKKGKIMRETLHCWVIK